MGTIDGTDWGSVTIDGQEVQEITVDGDVVWSAMSGIFADASSYTVYDNATHPITVDGSTGLIDGLINDEENGYANYVDFGFAGGTTRTFDFNYTLESHTGNGAVNPDRRFVLLDTRDANGNYMFCIGLQTDGLEATVWDPSDGSSNWDTLNNDGEYHRSGIYAQSLNSYSATWNGSAWVISINDGEWTYTCQHYNAPATTARVGGNQYTTHGHTNIHEYHVQDMT